MGTSADNTRHRWHTPHTDKGLSGAAEWHGNPFQKPRTRFREPKTRMFNPSSAYACLLRRARRHNDPMPSARVIVAGSGMVMLLSVI